MIYTSVVQILPCPCSASYVWGILVLWDRLRGHYKIKTFCSWNAAVVLLLTLSYGNLAVKNNELAILRRS